MLRHLIASILAMLPLMTFASDAFEIRGVLPWHNFLCGPSAWNEIDYEHYLDNCKAHGINFVGFHNYTGGGERYATYVEPMIQITYNNIVPQAYFDNSGTCRWGSLPLKLSEYPFGSASAVKTARGADVFGSDVSVKSRTPQEHYAGAKKLMQRVLDMAHKRGIKMAMGFEFGVVPPEYFSLNAAGDCFFWLGRGNMIPNPCHAVSVGLHNAALDDLLATYPGIDYVWLWLNEHSFLGVDTKKVLAESPEFAAVYKEKAHYFEEATSDEERFIGVWSLTYIEMTLRRIKEKGMPARLILGGWGGGNQLPNLLRGLDRALPQEVIFSCLNPALGTQSQPAFLAEIAKSRDVWALPWLEGDHQIWHFQPRVNLMKEHVRLAAKQNLKGVAVCHWRTVETKYNFNTFARLAANPDEEKSVEQYYKEYFTSDFGPAAAARLAPILADVDINQLQATVSSPDYFAFTPVYGRLDEGNVAFRKQIIEAVDEVLPCTGAKEHVRNLKHFKAMFEFELLLDRVVRAMEPAWKLRSAECEGKRVHATDEYKTALKTLESAPFEEMVHTYMDRVSSRGEMGVLSSVNQRVWGSYRELKKYLAEKINK